MKGTVSNAEFVYKYALLMLPHRVRKKVSSIKALPHGVKIKQLVVSAPAAV